MLLPVLVVLLGGTAAGCGNDDSRSTGPAALTSPAPQERPADTNTVWPSYPLPDQLRSPTPDGWPTPLPPTRLPGGSTPPEVVAPIPPPVDPTPPAGGVGGSDSLATRSSAHATGPDRAMDQRPTGYQRSLVYSGLLGLLIAAIGLTMVGRRRRLW
ncbi:hypothetical protein OG792_33280 [Micromonospora sp. NBC_01699]|uniref:hypothetical protein n=1 Tax=Micromonospora sp. NBC_01699 TaxID=2975984 RepID=UPI002E27AA94|nr:hypothetical protein [Micromonospora sp. NBC_01699]